VRVSLERTAETFDSRFRANDGERRRNLSYRDAAIEEDLDSAERLAISLDFV
jgi:hypothetical protein